MDSDYQFIDSINSAPQISYQNRSPKHQQLYIYTYNMTTNNVTITNNCSISNTITNYNTNITTGTLIAQSTTTTSTLLTI